MLPNLPVVRKMSLTQLALTSTQSIQCLLCSQKAPEALRWVVAKAKGLVPSRVWLCMQEVQTHPGKAEARVNRSVAELPERVPEVRFALCSLLF